MNTCKFSFILLFFAVASLKVSAQSFDYKKRPAFDFKFSDARINLRVDPQNGAVSGWVQYTVQANIAGADTLALNAAELQIDSVSSRGKSLAFTAKNNLLNIIVADSVEMGASYPVKIFYHGTPEFGLLKSSEGTVWTSMLPLSNQHWLPVKDHPRVQMVTTLSLQFPAGYTAFASGVETDNTMLPDSSRRVTFRTSRPIPVTALTFGLGHFREKGASVGIKRLNSYAEANSISGAGQVKLLDKTKEILGQIERATGTDYPYQRLDLVILNDHHWEQKPYGATTIYLYKNRGDWISQLRRGLYAQWVGVYRHEEQWAEAWAVHFLQTALHGMVSDSAVLLKAHADEPEANFSTVYDHFSAETWNHWQHYEAQNKRPATKQLLSTFLQQGAGTITPASFNDAWYSLSGQPSMAVPTFGKEMAASFSSKDTLRYRVDYVADETSGGMKLIFKAQQGIIDQPLTLPVQITPGDNAQVTIAGSADTVSVSAPAGTQNIEVKIPQGQPLVLEQHKPVAYLLYQLRNAETVEQKRQAAIEIGYDTDNPDLQLALNDVMKQDMEPEVKAALLKSYGAITNGAEGTQQRFLDAIDSKNPAVRRAALDVLANYKSKKITTRFKALSQDESNPGLSRQALKLYMQRVDSTTAISFTNALVQQDTAGTRAIIAIGLLGEKGSKKKAVQLAGYYMEPVYGYAVRSQALHILLANDSSAENWKKRTQKLLGDSDPRIRFLMVKNIDQIPGVDAASVLSSHQEYDARVSKVSGEF